MYRPDILYDIYCRSYLCKSNALDILKIWPALEALKWDQKIYPNISEVILLPIAIQHAIIFTPDTSYDVYYKSNLYEWNTLKISKILQRLKVVQTDNEIRYFEYSCPQQLYSMQSFVQKIPYLMNNIWLINSNLVTNGFHWICQNVIEWELNP